VDFKKGNSIKAEWSKLYGSESYRRWTDIQTSESKKLKIFITQSISK